MPAQPAGRRVERDDGVGVEVRALAIATIEVRRGGADRKEDQPSLDVDRHDGPDVDAGAIAPRPRLPRVVPGLSLARHGVEPPHELSRAHVPRADVAARTARHAFGHERAGDHEIAEDRRRRRHAVRARHVGHAGAEVHRPALAERRHGTSGARVERDEPAVDRAVDDASVARAVGRSPLPVRDAAVRRAGTRPLAPSVRVERPALSPRLGVERDDALDAPWRDRARRRPPAGVVWNAGGRRTARVLALSLRVSSSPV